MIAFQDFAPAITQSDMLSRQHEPMGVVMERVNAWIAQYAVRVMNIETVMLPNINGSPGSSHVTGLMSHGEIRTYWCQVIRVWYEHAGALQ